MARVRLEGVEKAFDKGVVAVKELTLEVKDKEFMVLVGPSGCGKSTTLRMIAGLEEVTKGKVYIGDRLCNDVPPKDRNIAMVFQNYALYPHMTAYQNMSFGLKLRKFPKEEVEKRVREAAAILGIEKLLNRKPKELSGGERQRVAVGRAIVRKPDVFLFDEPLSNLDAKMRVQMRAELSRLHKRLATTIIYVTHDQMEAMTMGERIAVMKAGVIQQVATPLTLYHRPINRFVAGFIGSPSMNFVEGKLIREEGLTFWAKGFKARLPQSFAPKLAPFLDKEVIFGLRPEDIHPSPPPYPIEEGARIKVRVDVVEPMGNEMFLYIRAEEDQLIARMGSDVKMEVGEEAEVILAMQKAHFFDPQTENNITL